MRGLEWPDTFFFFTLFAFWAFQLQSCDTNGLDFAVEISANESGEPKQ